MITKQEALLDLLGLSNAQLVIPVYQRVYAWTEKQCEALWSDICQAGRTGSTHFVGAVLYAEEPPLEMEGECADCLRRIAVIDGQQRLATVSLLLAALRDHLREAGAPALAVSADDISRRYLRMGDSRTCKLLLSRVDRATMSAIVSGTDMPEDEDEVTANIVANYEFFRSKVAAETDLEVFWRGLGLLTVISAQLGEEDRAQLVFESLNSKGMPLTTVDLIRNLLLVNASLDEQARLYELHWSPIEQMFADDADSARFNAALRGWLAIKAPGLSKRSSDDVYGTFKAFMESEHVGSLEDLLFGLRGFCESFIARSQSAGARVADAHNSYGVAKVEGIISEKKLFGE